MSPFRGSEHDAAVEVHDPLARFIALSEAMERERSMFGDRIPLRFVAINLVLHPGEPDALAAEVDRLTAGLNQRLSWASAVAPAVRTLIAGVLLEREDTPDAFLDEVDRVREIMSEVGVRRREIFQVLAILALRVRNELAPIEREQIESMQAIYEAMKTHHWLLTGPEDLPACAFLSGRRESPEAIAQRASDIFHALRKTARLWQGDPLQTASNVLALSGVNAEDLAVRFRALAQGLHAQGVRVGVGEYDDVAVLCFLPQPIDKIVETVVEYRRQIREDLSWSERGIALNLAVNLAFVRLVGRDPELGAVANAKSLLDMQTIVAARQAAAGAAAAGAS